jgi:hypothetical protein
MPMIHMGTLGVEHLTSCTVFCVNSSNSRSQCLAFTGDAAAFRFRLPTWIFTMTNALKHQPYPRDKGRLFGGPALVTWLMASNALVPDAVSAQPPTAYRQVAEAAGIPAQLLYAVAQTESNTQLSIGYYPWPWTLNVNGKPLRFETQELACQAIHTAIAQEGIYAVDIGLTQQNWGYIGRTRFREPCEALNPLPNLQSAALLLRQYYKQTGDWISAAGMYHRPAGGEPARLYRSKITLRLKGMVADR